MSELIDKYDRKLLVIKEKKYTIPVVKIIIGASSAPSSQVVIEKRMEDLT